MNTREELEMIKKFEIRIRNLNIEGDESNISYERKGEIEDEIYDLEFDIACLKD